MSQNLPAGQNRALPLGRSRFFAGAYRDEQDRLRFRFQADSVEVVAGLTVPVTYWQFIREMVLDRIMRRDIDARRLAEKAIRILRTRHPIQTPALMGVKV